MKDNKNLSSTRTRKRHFWRERIHHLAHKLRPNPNRAAFFIILIAIALLTVALSRPTPGNFEVGKKAGHTFMCDRDMEVVDEEATLRAQSLAASQAIPIFELDYQVNAESLAEFRRLFALGRVLTHSGLSGIPENFQEAFCGLFIMADCPGSLAQVWGQGFDQKLENLVSLLTSEIMSQGLMDQSDSLKAFEGRDIEISRVWAGNSIVKYSSFLTVPRAKNLVEARAALLAIGYGQDFTDLLSILTLGLLRPNLTLDQSAWEHRQKQAAAQVRVVHFLKAGEIIVREGDLITPMAGLKLKALTNRETQGGLSIRPSLGLIFLLLVFLAVTQTLIHLDRESSEIDYREMILISLLILWFVILSWWSGHLTRGLLREVTHIEARTMFMSMPFPAAAMLGAIFLGLRRTVYICFLGGFLGAIATSQVNTLSAFIYICNGCMVSIWGLRHISERARFIPSSLLAALVNCLTMMALTLTDGNLLSTQFLYNLMAAALSGLLAGILASGLVTLIEAALGLTTNLKLMELGNLNRPLLRELM
ncbi:MAG: hypothetical protein LBE80_06210, partial [Deltaproteobacteria bacterium]|nr:hypothetical protein [Deltaproteobacteria bacterium]